MDAASDSWRRIAPNCAAELRASYFPPFSPVHIARKFSAARGDSLAYSTNSIRPVGTPPIVTSNHTCGLPGRSRRSVFSASAARRASTIAAASDGVNAPPDVHGQPSPRLRTSGSVCPGSSPRLPQHSPNFWPLQPSASPHHTHTVQPLSPPRSARCRCFLHDSQHAAALGCVFDGPQITTAPSYSSCASA